MASRHAGALKAADCSHPAAVFGGPLQETFLGHALLLRSATLVASAASSPLSHDPVLRRPTRCPTAPCRSHSGCERAPYLPCGNCFSGRSRLPQDLPALAAAPNGVDLLTCELPL